MNIYHKINIDQDAIKRAVKKHWETEPCEYRYGKNLANRREFVQEIDASRYSLSPFIPSFAKFEEGKNQKVLEIGLGSGSDFIRWARSGAQLWGRDLTETSVNLVLERLNLEGLDANVSIGDVEKLEFDDEFFDIVYSYGVIHHTPNTPKAVKEIYRVLKKNGIARVMIYNLRGLTFFYQWILFGLLKMKPHLSRREIAFYYNESMGTKLYTVSEARKLFSQFKSVKIKTIIDAGDILNFKLSKRYNKIALIVYCQKLFKIILKYLQPLIPSQLGTTMLIEVVK